MPVIKVDMWPGRGRDVKRELIEKLTQTTCDTLDIPAEAVTVILNEVDKDNWGMNGAQASRL